MKLHNEIEGISLKIWEWLREVRAKGELEYKEDIGLDTLEKCKFALRQICIAIERLIVEGSKKDKLSEVLRKREEEGANLFSLNQIWAMNGVALILRGREENLQEWIKEIWQILRKSGEVNSKPGAKTNIQFLPIEGKKFVNF